MTPPQTGRDNPDRQRMIPGFIGWGEQNQAVWRALKAGGVANPRFLTGGEPTPTPEGMVPTAQVEKFFAGAQAIFLDVPLPRLAALLPTVRLAISDQHLIAVTGKKMALADLLDHLIERKVMRCLIHPAQDVKEDIVVFHPSVFVSPGDITGFRELFHTSGVVLSIDTEPQFDVVRTLAALTPALVYTLADALADGGLMLGLPREKGLTVLRAVLNMAADRLYRKQEPPSVLREAALLDEDASAGLMELEASGLRGELMRVVGHGARIKGKPGTPPVKNR
ncbi:MAG: hypothetical protein OEW12_07340 [Deltaproteobacteria bacterium]|nr:hypothetical protein [Deltaproteobacteria bacterium]